MYEWLINCGHVFPVWSCPSVGRAGASWPPPPAKWLQSSRRPVGCTGVSLNTGKAATPSASPSLVRLIKLHCAAGWDRQTLPLLLLPLLKHFPSNYSNHRLDITIWNTRDSSLSWWVFVTSDCLKNLTTHGAKQKCEESNNRKCLCCWLTSNYTVMIHDDSLKEKQF